MYWSKQRTCKLQVILFFNFFVVGLYGFGVLESVIKNQ
jgi:hypothetical protein